MDHFDKSLDALTALYNLGLLVPSADIGVKKQPDGRIHLSLKRQLRSSKAAATSGGGTPGTGACLEYDDFWPSYYHDPADGYTWRKYCFYNVRFDYVQSTSTVSNVHKVGADGTILETPGWFVPDGAAVPELLTIFSPSPPDNIRVTVQMEMCREVHRGSLGGQQPRTGNQEDSIPFVFEVCYDPL